MAARIDELADHTPASRDRPVDLLRVLAIAVVVLGHWLMAVVTYEDGDFEATNALANVPLLRLATWLFQVMPLFFIVGGVANRAGVLAVRRDGGGWPAYVARRVDRLTRPVVPLVAAWLVAAAALAASPLDTGIVERATTIVAQPLWFLAAYLVVAALAPVMVAWHERAPRQPFAVLVAAVVVVDAARLTGTAAWLGWANYAFVFLFAQQLGIADHAGAPLRRPAVARATLGGALLTLAVLTAGPYPLSMVGVPGEEVSNMSPPTLCILVLAVAQASGVALARPTLERWTAHRSVWRTTIAANVVVMTVFLWHLTALVLVAGTALPLGFPQPEPGTPAWWLTRLPWIALLAAVLAPLVLVAGRWERPREPTPRTAAAATPPRALATAALSVGALSAFALAGFSSRVALVAAVALVAVRYGPRT